LALELGFSASEATLIATAISELSRNIVSYAGHGEITLRSTTVGGRLGLVIVAADSGPGIADVELAIRDGYSSMGGLGLGLPGVRRLMDEFELISALLHVLKNIERMGDQCVNICKVIPMTGHEPPADPEMVKLILTMGTHTKSLISQAKRAFEERNVEMARDLVARDDVVDELNRDCFRLALAIGDDADKREWAMTMLLAARAIERIGDNAVDIGEQTSFLVTGEFREFTDASH